jgi:hypothetical protein
VWHQQLGCISLRKEQITTTKLTHTFSCFLRCAVLTRETDWTFFVECVVLSVERHVASAGLFIFPPSLDLLLFFAPLCCPCVFNGWILSIHTPTHTYILMFCFAFPFQSVFATQRTTHYSFLLFSVTCSTLITYRSFLFFFPIPSAYSTSSSCFSCCCRRKAKLP